MWPLVTIAVPNFNQGAYIGEAIRSAVEQTYPELEIIVSDNASTDNSIRAISEVRDERIRVVRQPRNIGLLPNWNFCLSEARGKYFKLLQADDVLLPECVERAVQALEEDSASACLMSYGRIDEQGQPIEGGEERVPREGLLERDHLLTRARRFSSFVPSSGNMYEVSMARARGGYGDATRTYGDTLLWSQMIAAGRACGVTAVLAKERVHRAQARRQGNPMALLRDMQEALGTLRIACETREAAAEIDAWEAETTRQAALAATALLMKGELGRSGRLLRAMGQWRFRGAIARGLIDGAEIGARRLFQAAAGVSRAMAKRLASGH